MCVCVCVEGRGLRCVVCLGGGKGSVAWSWLVGGGVRQMVARVITSDGPRGPHHGNGRSFGNKNGFLPRVANDEE